jgi:hypothetical protein
VAIVQAALWVIAWQFGIVVGQRLQPVVALGLQRRAAGVGDQAFGPGLYCSGLGGQVYGLAVQQLLVGFLQVFQQHPPRHAVHHKMVNHQQQTLLAIGEIEQFGAQQWPLFQVQAGLYLVAGSIQLA